MVYGFYGKRVLVQFFKNTNIVYENNTYIIDYFTSCIKENCYLKKKLNIQNSSNSDVL